MKRRYWFLVLGKVVPVAAFILVSILFAGCDKPRALHTTLGQGSSLEYQEKVISKGFTLEHYLRVARHKASRTESNLLQIKIGLENIKHGDDDDIWCDVQVVFYDEEGFELEKTNWAPLFLSAGQITFYETCSLSDKAHDYTIFLRRPRKTSLD